MTGRAPSCSCTCTAGLVFCLAACPTSLSWAQSKTLQLRASTDAFKLTQLGSSVVTGTLPNPSILGLVASERAALPTARIHPFPMRAAPCFHLNIGPRSGITLMEAPGSISTRGSLLSPMSPVR